MQSCDAGHMVLGQTIAQFHGGDLLVTWQQQSDIFNHFNDRNIIPIGYLFVGYNWITIK